MSTIEIINQNCGQTTVLRSLIFSTPDLKNLGSVKPKPVNNSMTRYKTSRHGNSEKVELINQGVV